MMMSIWHRDILPFRKGMRFEPSYQQSPTACVLEVVTMGTVIRALSEPYRLARPCALKKISIVIVQLTR
jgi:hypothetical protein